MSYVIVHHFPGGTKQQYEASIAAVHPSRETLPKGQVNHVAGPSSGGWTIVVTYDSKENWQKFRDGVLLPRMKAGIPGGFGAPPEETSFEVYNQQP